MKHLLIILSILLLSSPLFGQETGVLYQYETSSGLVWKTFGDGKVQPKYKGEIKNGKPNGFGFQTYKNGNKYFGGHKNGLPNGQGRSIYPDGSMYLGEYMDGKFHGQGTYTYGKGKWEGEKFVGEWKDGKRWNGTYYDKEGNIHSKVVNGKGQK